MPLLESEFVLKNRGNVFFSALRVTCCKEAKPSEVYPVKRDGIAESIPCSTQKCAVSPKNDSKFNIFAPDVVRYLRYTESGSLMRGKHKVDAVFSAPSIKFRAQVYCFRFLRIKKKTNIIFIHLQSPAFTWLLCVPLQRVPRSRYWHVLILYCSLVPKERETQYFPQVP